jgi:hypothetical protein
MYLVEARRTRRADRPAGFARFILVAGSRYAALSKLRLYYDTSDVDSLTAHPVSGVIPLAGAMVHDMLRGASDARLTTDGEERDESGDDGEAWRK